MLHSQQRSHRPCSHTNLAGDLNPLTSILRRIARCWFLFLIALFLHPGEFAWGQIPRRPGRPSSVDIGNRFLRDQNKERQKVIDALSKQKSEASKFLEAANPELIQLQQTASQIDARRQEIAKLVEEDGDKVGAAKRNARAVEEKVLAQEPADSAYGKALAVLNERVAEEDKAYSEALSLPLLKPKNRLELQTALGKLTTAQKAILEKAPAYQEAKRKTREAAEVENNARQPVLKKSPEVVAALAAISDAEAEQKKSKANQVLVNREASRANTLVKTLQTKMTAAMVTISSADAELAKLNTKK